MNDLKEHLLQLETSLLQLEIRSCPQKINTLLSEDFTEFTSSGSVYHFKPGDVFMQPDHSTPLNWEITNFEIKPLSEDCILVLYQLIKHDELNLAKKYSLRSSIWKCIDGQWKMFFHQGTCMASTN